MLAITNGTFQMYYLPVTNLKGLVTSSSSDMVRIDDSVQIGGNVVCCTSKWGLSDSSDVVELELTQPKPARLISESFKLRLLATNYRTSFFSSYLSSTKQSCILHVY